MTCTVEKRQRLRYCAEQLRAHEECVSAVVVEPAASAYGRWTLEILFDSDPIHHGILRLLADYRLSVVSVGPNHGYVSVHCVL